MRSVLLAVVVMLGVILVSKSPVLAQEPGDNPIIEIALDMNVVVQDLARLSTGKPTQETQKQIVTKLDELIERLEKECEACRGGGAKSRNPTKPLADSVIKAGPGGMGDLHAPRSGGKKWGELPPHQRDRILQAQTEGFPAHYQQILERYFRRLAEEKPAIEPDNADKAGSSTEPEASPPARPANKS